MKASIPPSNVVRSRVTGALLACLSLVWLAAPAFAVKPFRYQTYQLPKARLKSGMSIAADHKHEYRPKLAPNHRISHNGVVPQYQRPHWNWARPRKSR